MTVISHRSPWPLIVTCPTFRFMEEEHMRRLGLGMLAALNVVTLERLPEERRREETPNPPPQDRMMRGRARRRVYLEREVHPRDYSGQDLTEAEQEEHRAFMRLHEAASTRRLSRRERKARR